MLFGKILTSEIERWVRKDNIVRLCCCARMCISHKIAVVFIKPQIFLYYLNLICLTEDILSESAACGACHFLVPWVSGVRHHFRKNKIKIVLKQTYDKVMELVGGGSVINLATLLALKLKCYNIRTLSCKQVTIVIGGSDLFQGK